MNNFIKYLNFRLEINLNFINDHPPDEDELQYNLDLL